MSLVSVRPGAINEPMPQDPNAQFDQTVLGMIEHSPTGAVPMTPSYQDALKRLYASHQVYADADHANGHVAARSLAQRPHFHANNLEALMAGQIEPASLEANGSIFDRYVRSLPAAAQTRAESFRLTVAGKAAHHRAKHVGPDKIAAAPDPMHTLFLVPGAGPHPGLPGNYLYGAVVESRPGSARPWSVHLHDSDDGDAVFETTSMAEALAKVAEVRESAPFALSELGALGFTLK